MKNNAVLPVFDGHNDTLLMTYLPGVEQRPFFKETENGHIDFPRAKAGGLFGGLFAIFVPHPDMEVTDLQGNDDEDLESIPSKLLEPVPFSYAYDVAKKGIESLYTLESESAGKVKVVKSIETLFSAKDAGMLCIVLHFEGAEPIHPNLENLSEFYELGLRSVGIVWSRENSFGHGVSFKFPGTPDMGPGLTDAGKQLVRQCNQMGIMIDVSHLNEKGFWDVERISHAPLVASHSCVHSLCPSPRNMTDKQLDAIASTGGLVGINFSVAFIRQDGKHNADTPLSEMVSHFRYIVDRIGVDHVALGSDFDGALISTYLKDAAGLPNLMDALGENGFNKEELEKMAWRNWFRVLNHTWK